MSHTYDESTSKSDSNRIKTLQKVNQNKKSKTTSGPSKPNGKCSQTRDTEHTRLYNAIFVTTSSEDELSEQSYDVDLSLLDRPFFKAYSTNKSKPVAENCNKLRKSKKPKKIPKPQVTDKKSKCDRPCLKNLSK